jgi:hypothetical protein
MTRYVVVSLVDQSIGTRREASALCSRARAEKFRRLHTFFSSAHIAHQQSRISPAAQAYGRDTIGISVVLESPGQHRGPKLASMSLLACMNQLHVVRRTNNQGRYTPMIKCLDDPSRLYVSDINSACACKNKSAARCKAYQQLRPKINCIHARPRLYYLDLARHIICMFTYRYHGYLISHATTSADGYPTCC